MKKIDEILEILKSIDTKITLLIEKNKEFRPSKKQIALVFQIAKEKNISKEFLEEIVKEVCGVKRIDQIKSKEKFEKLVKFLKNRS